MKLRKYQNRFYFALFVILISCITEKGKEDIEVSNVGYIHKKFYPSGILLHEETFVHDKRYGEAFYYYNDQDTFIYKKKEDYYLAYLPLIKYYRVFNSMGNIAFEVSYNKEGIAINKFGKTIIEYFAPLSAKKEDTIHFELLIPRPPNFKNSVFFGKVEDGIIHVESELKAEGKSPYFDLDYILNESGDKEYIFISKIFNNNSIIMIDTAMFKINVK